MAKSKYASLHERLLLNSEVNEETLCLVWKGYTQKDGYVSKSKGYGRINLTLDGRSCKFPPHRVAKVEEEIRRLKPDFDFYDPKHKQEFFDLYRAYSASKLTIDHLCKNSLCLNPDHLEWVRLSNNVWRKKWSDKQRKERMGLIAKRVTRHDKIVQASDTVRELIRKIQTKTYRTKVIEAT